MHILLGIVLIAILASIIASVLYAHAPQIVELLQNGDIEGIEDYISASGWRGRFFLILFQTVETVLIFLPALPVYIAAGVVYGPLEGTLICYLTNIVVNLAMFKSLDFLKDKTDDLFGSRKNKRLEAWLKSQPHPLRAIFLLCLLPVAPAGMVTILAHKTGLSQKQYFKALALGCLPGIAISVLFGNFLMNYVLNILRSRLHIPQGF